MLSARRPEGPPALPRHIPLILMDDMRWVGMGEIRWKLKTGSASSVSVQAGLPASSRAAQRALKPYRTLYLALDFVLGSVLVIAISQLPGGASSGSRHAGAWCK